MLPLKRKAGASSPRSIRSYLHRQVYPRIRKSQGKFGTLRSRPSEINNKNARRFARHPRLGATSVLGNGWIDLIGPSEDAAFQVENLAKARLSQEVHGFGGTLSAAAMRDDFAGGIEFVDATRQLPKREEMPFEIADLVFVGLAYIENEEIISAVEPGLEFTRSNLRHLHCWARGLFAAHAAEFVVIDQFGDGRMRAAHGTIRVLAQLELAELHRQSVKEQQAPNEIISAAENQLDRFHRLDGANDAGQNSKDATFGAGRHKSRRGRFGIEAAVARTIGHAENRRLPFKSENRTVHVRLFQQNTCVVDEIARGEIVGAVYDDIEVLEELERVGAGQLRLERLDLNVRIEIREARAGGFALRFADVAGAKRNLALEVGEVDDIKVNQPEFADARSGEIKTKWSAQPARADEQHLGILQLELPVHADLRHDEVAAVAQDFFIREARYRFGTGLRLYGGGHCDSLLLQISNQRAEQSMTRDFSLRS